MPTSSITHNFVVKDLKGAEVIIDALDGPGFSENVNVETVEGADNVRVLMNRWRENKVNTLETVERANAEKQRYHR